jgi:hypothetical protein
MTRRGERFGKKGREATFGGIDFGQDAYRLYWVGSEALTDVSNGTKVVTITGMGTLTHFFPSIEIGAGAQGVTAVVAVVQGHATNAGVTLACFVETGVSMAAKMSGATLHYMAIGTQA